MMRIVDRIVRLEQREGDYPQIPAEEMEFAAQRFESALIRDGVPGGGSVQDALTDWRNVVANCQPWARRVYLNADPMDLFV